MNAAVLSAPVRCKLSGIPISSRWASNRAVRSKGAHVELIRIFDGNLSLVGNWLGHGSHSNIAFLTVS
jgi:hypothetical protein